jgi:5'-3' exonuclease
MGIPSYYKKLIDTVPGLVIKGSNVNDTNDIQWLFMDYNCLIYHCLHREDTPAYTADNESWESQFLECIVKYTLKVIKKVSPKMGVFIAIDGVVPMAKMRQQRLRRFKSIWLTQHPEFSENKGDNTSNGPVWDRNSITPGTVFMSKLRKRLETMIKQDGKKTWVLSSSDEPGEGEHKIIAEWRTRKYTGNFAVYGLDADLIVLTILGRELCGFENKVWLFREEVNAGKIAYDSVGEELFEWFSINALGDWLSAEFIDVSKRSTFILNYCFAMSVLGNDFLPGSLGLKIREDGHSELLDIIRTLTHDNIALVVPETLQVSYEGIKTLFTILSGTEEARIQKYIHKKQILSRNITGNNDGADIKLGDNNWPLSHIEENILVNGKMLQQSWKETYLTHFFNGFTFNKRAVHRVCKDYLYGIQWIWAYYTGIYENVCFNWFYPFNLPPLWIWLKDYLNECVIMPEFPEKVLVRATDIRPVEQLVLVLPLESWSLIPACLEKRLPHLAPQFYPSEFSFESVGKRYFWECESMIPLPSILEVKEIIRINTNTNSDG